MALRFAATAVRSSMIIPRRSMACAFTTSRIARSAEISSPKVQQIYDQLVTLNIVETIELVNVLKEKFGYVEQAIVAAPAGGGGAAAAAPVEEVKVVEKTEFTVRLNAFDAASKIKVIKEVRTITGLGLKQAKDLVEAAPNAVIKKDIAKVDAEAMLKLLKEVGGEAVME